MPCYQVTLTSVELKTADMDTLKDALKSLSLSFTEGKNSLVVQTPAGTITIQNGQASYSNNNCQKWVNKIKQAYSSKTIERIAKRYKFNVVTKPNATNQITLRRY